MRIYLEGPDAVGKSTLAERLHKKTGFKVIHSDGPSKFEYFNSFKDNQIYDRCHFSELVYHKIHNRESLINPIESKILLDSMIKNKDLVIGLYCSDLDLIRNRFIERGEFEFLPFAEAQLRGYLELYKELEETSLRLVTMDVALEEDINSDQFFKG